MVERLPIGNAIETGKTFVLFVFSPAPGREFRFSERGPSPWRSVGIDARAGVADIVSGGGGASESSAEWTVQLRLAKPCELEFTYSGDGGTLVRESVFVDPAATEGQHRVDLPDGSVIERLPIGVAGGAYWLRFVRTRIPDSEIERYEAYDEEVDAALEEGDDQPDIDEPWPPPLERFITLRSEERQLRPQNGGYTGGGREQHFEVAVSTDQVTSDLEIIYRFDSGDVLVSERFDL
ncbi:hypothetical protein [Nocardioides sp. Root190]|uniref:hypothetical protein n=1 Tax=Nocardioides sp. Root190 TaxID=1736488 RepID=UPI000A552A4C|nr:hypothetical protein [Nocardioides sp. Root190]